MRWYFGFRLDLKYSDRDTDKRKSKGRHEDKDHVETGIGVTSAQAKEYLEPLKARRDFPLAPLERPCGHCALLVSGTVKAYIFVVFSHLVVIIC
jgi:hypothetical protein